jgi:hypothetical protein
MDDTPQSRGGQERARLLTTEERREIALKAAEARWARVRDPNRITEAETDGVLAIGDVELDVYVLKDRRRVFSKRAMARALHLKSAGGNAFLRTMSRKGVRSVLSEKLLEKIENPLFFKPLTGDSADGYEAEVLIEVCDALIQARNEDKLAPSQFFLAVQAEIIIRACAKVGIIALIDEATGYRETLIFEGNRICPKVFSKTSILLIIRMPTTVTVGHSPPPKQRTCCNLDQYRGERVP